MESVSQILRTVLVINLAGFAMPGLPIGLIVWGYVLVDDYENVRYILMCGLPLTLFAVLLKPIRLNSATTAATKPTDDN